MNGVLLGKGNKAFLYDGVKISLIRKRPHEQSPSYSFHDLRTSKLPTKKSSELSTVEEVYDIRETLGSGNFAAVKLAIHKETGKRYALKMIDKRKYLKFGMNRKGTLMDEVNILKRIAHPNIISIEEVFDSEQTLCIVLELVTGGELFDHIIECGYFDEMKARKLFLQITEAIHYLHQNGIAHRGELFYFISEAKTVPNDSHSFRPKTGEYSIYRFPSRDPETGGLWTESHAS